MQNYLPDIRKTLTLIDVIEKKYGIKPNNDVEEPLLYCGVANSDLIAKLSAEFFGKPYKAAGKGAFFMNFFDRFVREVGGARKEQTLYRKEFGDQICMYCAFWPWGSQPVKTSVRIGLVCYGADERDFFVRELKGEF
jgi:hypothetical protein